MIDPFEETRAVELNSRLTDERRGLFSVPELLSLGSAGGARALGWPSGGITVGGLADLVSIRLSSVRLAGASPARLSHSAAGGRGDPAAASADPGAADPTSDEALLARVLFGASPADVDTVVVGGNAVVNGGEHVTFGAPERIAERLGRAVAAALGVA